MPVTTHRTFALPDTLPAVVLIQAEALWTATTEDADDALADLLGLGPGDGHDELTRCDNPDCRAWFWADEGASVHYESGTVLTVCAAHAIADDPGARVYPGVGLESEWRAAEDADHARCILATGRPW